MRTLHFLTVICIVGTYAVAFNILSETAPSLEECLKEWNIDTDELQKLVGDESFKFKNLPDLPEKFHCIFPCLWAEDRKIKGYNKTIHEVLMYDVKNANAHRGIKNESYLKELEYLLNGCNSKGLNECDYIKCINFLKPPVWDFYINGG